MRTVGADMQDVNSIVNQAFSVLTMAFDITVNLKPGAEDGPFPNRSVQCAVSFEDNAHVDAPIVAVTADEGKVLAYEVYEDHFKVSVPVELAGFPQLNKILNRYRSTDLWETSDLFVRGSIQFAFNLEELEEFALGPGGRSFELDKVLAFQLRGQEDALADELLFRWGRFLMKMAGKPKTPDEYRSVRQAAALIFDQSATWEHNSHDHNRMEKLLAVCALAEDLTMLGKKFPDAFNK